MLSVSLFFLLSCATSSKSTSNNSDCILAYDTLSNQEVYVYVDKMPRYQGGSEELLLFFAENFNYPKQEQLQGTFLIEFIIDKDGKLIAPRIKDKNMSELSESEKEVLGIMERMPRWNAGSCHEKKVPVKMFLPLKL